MITLHHLDQSRSFRILWALEELELDYQVQFYQRLPTFAAPPELKLVHPLAINLATYENIIKNEFSGKAAA